MGIVAFVMDYEGKEVFNAFYSEDLGSILGIESGSDAISMTIGPNPSTGNFSVAASLPDGVNGTVDVFDITGRVVGSASSDSAEFSVEEAGLYLVRLSSPAGDSITKSIIVIR